MGLLSLYRAEWGWGQDVAHWMDHGTMSESTTLLAVSSIILKM